MAQGSTLPQQTPAGGEIIQLETQRRKALYVQVKEHAATCHLIELAAIHCQNEGFASLDTVEHIGFAVAQLKRDLERLALEIAGA